MGLLQKYQLSQSDDWPIETLLNYRVFDWTDGDGTNPTVGASLTAGGASTVAGISTGLVDSTGTNRTMSYFPGGTGIGYFASANNAYRMPTSSEDMVILFLMFKTRALLYNYPFQNFDGGNSRGWYASIGSTSSINITTSAGKAKAISVAGGLFGLNLFGFSLNRSGNATCFINGSAGTPVDCSSLGEFDSTGISYVQRLQYNVGVPGMEPVGISRALVFYGEGIATEANSSWHQNVYRRIFGIEKTKGISGATFTRGSTGTLTDSEGIRAFPGPRVSSSGLLIEPQRINLCYNNIDPQATTGLVTSGGTLQVVDDSTALNSAGLRILGPSAFEIANSTGSAVYVSCGAVTGNTNAHSVSVYARYVAGSGAKLGLWDYSASSFQEGVAVSDSFTRSTKNNITPSDSDCLFCLEIPNGCTLRFIGQQLEAGTYSSSLIINTATAATAARPADVFTMPDQSNSTWGSISATITPSGWSAGETGSQNVLTKVSSDTGSRIILDSENSQVEAYDGTNCCEASHTFVDGTPLAVKVSYGGNIIVQADDEISSSSYDGAFSGTGNLQITGGSYYVKNLEIRSNK